MGICFSTKKEKPEKLSPLPSPSPPPIKEKKTVNVEDEGKKHVFIITHGTKPTGPTQPQLELAPVILEKKSDAVPRKAVVREEVKLEEEERIVPARMSNCTKEELDAILIQCGRISRSPSWMEGSGSAEKGKRRSGSKRSYDFDAEKEGEVEGWEGKAGLSSGRPSPRRRASNRERSEGERKRSKSRERGGGGSSGGRRVSRSPVRKSEGGLYSSSKTRQPEKMVSVPATEKGKNTVGAPRRNPPANHPLRSSSPRHRSRSPATLRASSCSNNEDSHPPPYFPQHPPKSPYRRNPMSEIDTNISQSKAEKTRKAASPSQTRPTNSNRSVLHRDKLLTYRAKDPSQQQQPEPHPSAEETAVIKSNGAEGTLKRSSSRRFSRDFDAPVDAHPAPNSYTSLLLEDIQNYHHQNTGFSLPACVTKACSILDAVAGLTGSETCGSSNDLKKKEERAANPTGGNMDKFVETELGVNDDLMESSIQKYVPSSVEAAVPEESTGSNSYVGQARMHSPSTNTTTTGSTQEQNNSVDSSDVCWTSSSWSNSNTCEEEEQQQPQPPQKKMINPSQKILSESDNKQQRTNSAPHVTTGSRPNHHRQQLRRRSNLP